MDSLIITMTPPPLWGTHFSFSENAIEAGRCVLNKQCTANGNTQSKRICIDGTCVCEEGYTLIQYTCHEGE